MDNRECLVLIRGQKPLKAYKVIPDEMSSYKDLKYTRVADYIPEWHKTDKEIEKRNEYKAERQNLEDKQQAENENISHEYESITPNFGSAAKEPDDSGKAIHTEKDENKC